MKFDAVDLVLDKPLEQATTEMEYSSPTINLEKEAVVAVAAARSENVSVSQYIL